MANNQAPYVGPIVSEAGDPYPQQPGHPQQGYPQQQGHPQQQGYPQPGYVYPPQSGYPPPPGFVPVDRAYGSGPTPATAAAAPKPAAAMYGSSSGEEPLHGDDSAFQFSDKTIRRGFIRKVYGVLMCQLLLTSAVIALFSFHEPTKLYVQSHVAIFWSAFGVMLVTLIAMSCCGDLRRKSPVNFVFLGLFTLAESVLMGVAASTYDTTAVLMAAGLTCIICFGLTVFAFQTKWDFTTLGAGLFIAVIILLVIGIFAMIWPSKTLIMVYCSIGVFLFSLYLIHDTQLMMGGKHKYSISPEEYIFAALNLYLDIINIFMYLLTIIGVSRN